MHLLQFASVMAATRAGSPTDVLSFLDQTLNKRYSTIELKNK